tara:strand:+ start:262 stop:435 length:174 start_codon:yes stop_codon:yes gene_type:complete
MVCPCVLAPPLMAGGGGMAAYFHKNKNIVTLGSLLVLLGIMLYYKPKKPCNDCKNNV